MDKEKRCLELQKGLAERIPELSIAVRWQESLKAFEFVAGLKLMTRAVLTEEYSVVVEENVLAELAHLLRRDFSERLWELIEKLHPELIERKLGDRARELPFDPPSQ